MTAISGPAAIPTVPGLRSPGGSGLLAIWCDASVIPYDSMTGQSNRLSSESRTEGGKAAEDERIRRSLLPATADGLRRARCRMAWCIVGTALYQVGRSSSTHLKNRIAWKPGLDATAAPAFRDESSPPIKPWIWNSGMMLRHLSSGTSLRAVAM